MRAPLLALLLFVFGVTGTGGGAATRPQHPAQVIVPTPQSHATAQPVENGYASFYSTNGRALVTASGEPFRDHRLTAAHKKLPFGTRVLVTNVANGKSVVVTINDRGPFVRSRVIDLTERAARDLDFMNQGLARVRLRVLSTAT